MQEALIPPVQDSVGSVVSGKFLVLQQKLADAAGSPTPQIAPGQAAIFARVQAMAAGRSD